MSFWFRNQGSSDHRITSPPPPNPPLYKKQTDFFLPKIQPSHRQFKLTPLHPRRK